MEVGGGMRICTFVWNFFEVGGARAGSPGSDLGEGKKGTGGLVVGRRSWVWGLDCGWGISILARG